MIVMPEAGLDGAAEVAGRIRARLAALRFAAAPSLHCTVSVGACEADTALNDVNVWVHDADAALYRAKSAGRDRFVAAGTAAAVETASHPPQPRAPVR
jgi:diguanylate cyclase